MGTVRLRFYAELGDLLPPEWRGRDVERPIGTGQTVKDLIEALGVPHTEVDLILVSREGGPTESVAFTHRLEDGDRVSVYPVFEALDITPATRLRPRPLRRTRFAADGHLGRLARYLRLLGFDTLYRNDWVDEELAHVAVTGHRVLLTRDRGLLKRSAVEHGYLVRSTDAREQLAEVIERFDLRGVLRPLTRCARCNGAVLPVAKEEVSARLPPRTRRHYEEFWLCGDCGRVYWKGGHLRSLQRLLEWAAGGEEEPGAGRR